MRKMFQLYESFGGLVLFVFCVYHDVGFQCTTDYSSFLYICTLATLAPREKRYYRGSQIRLAVILLKNLGQGKFFSSQMQVLMYDRNI